MKVSLHPINTCLHQVRLRQTQVYRTVLDWPTPMSWRTEDDGKRSWDVPRRRNVERWLSLPSAPSIPVYDCSHVSNLVRSVTIKSQCLRSKSWRWGNSVDGEAEKWSTRYISGSPFDKLDMTDGCHILNLLLRLNDVPLRQPNALFTRPHWKALPLFSFDHRRQFTDKKKTKKKHPNRCSVK